MGTILTDEEQPPLKAPTRKRGLFDTINKLLAIAQYDKNMKLENINPTSFDWDDLAGERFEGETGYATIKAQHAGAIQLRQVAYSTNYLADHWCDKGHVVFVISGQLIIQHKDNTEIVLNSGSTYVVGDDSMAHRATSTSGATVLIVD